jgi:hypothetical protein
LWGEGRRLKTAGLGTGSQSSGARLALRHAPSHQAPSPRTSLTDPGRVVTLVDEHLGFLAGLDETVPPCDRGDVLKNHTKNSSLLRGKCRYLYLGRPPWLPVGDTFRKEQEISVFRRRGGNIFGTAVSNLRGQSAYCEDWFQDKAKPPFAGPSR